MTQKAKTERCQAIRDKGNPVSKEDLDFLINNIFKYHFMWGEKAKGGVKRIFVDVAHGWGGKQQCFYIERADGQIDDISFKEAIKASSPKTRVHLILRNIIRPQIKAYKKTIDFNLELCEITVEKLIPDNTHIDHVIPFEKLATDWIKTTGKTLNELYALSEDEPNTTGVRRFKDNKLTKNFYDYHKKHAVLRAVTTKANLKRKRR